MAGYLVHSSPWPSITTGVGALHGEPNGGLYAAVLQGGGLALKRSTDAGKTSQLIVANLLAGHPELKNPKFPQSLGAQNGSTVEDGALSVLLTCQTSTTPVNKLYEFKLVQVRVSGLGRGQ